jgi:hypothetical protein
MEGIYPPYPGMAVVFGSIEFYLRDYLPYYGSEHMMICTCSLLSIFENLVD